MASCQVSCEWPSTLDTTTKVELDWPKSQDISISPVASDKSSVVEPFELVHRDLALPIIEETPAKTEQPLEALVLEVVPAVNQTEDTLTTSSEQKSGDSEDSMTVTEELVPESPTAESPLVSAVNEYGAEFKMDNPARTSPPITSKPEEPTDVAGSEILRTGTQFVHADLHVLDSFTEKIKPSEVLEERALPVDTPVSKIMDREVPTELIEEISEGMDLLPADWSLTALHFDQNKLKTDVLSTTVLTVQPDDVLETDEPAIGPAKGNGKIEIGVNGRENMQPALCEELHDAKTSVEGKPKETIGSDERMMYAPSLKQETDAVEELHRKRSFTSDTCEPLREDGKMPKKIIAALILDTDAVHICTTEVLGSTDHNAGRIDSASGAGFDSTLSQHMEQLDTQDEMRNEYDSHASLDQQGLDNAGNVVDSAKSGQPPKENIDRSLQTLVLFGQTTETQIITRNSEPNDTHAESEGTWTSNNGPQDVQRVMEPLEHLTVNNGPQQIHRRYIILERREGLEMSQEPATEANMPGLDAPKSESSGAVTEVSELEVTENEPVVGKESFEPEDRKRLELNAKKQSEALEIIETLPVPSARRKSERLPFSTEDKLLEEVDKVIVEVEITKITTAKEESKPTPPTRRSKECERLSVSSEVQFEEANLPVSQRKQDETQLAPAEVLPTPPNRRHKDKLGDERLSLDLDSQPTQAGHQQIELEKTSITVEETLVRQAPPVRQKVSQVESDSTSASSKTEKMEDTLVKSTPPPRKEDIRKVTEPVPSGSDLDKTRTEEIAVDDSLEKPTPPVRQNASADESTVNTPPISEPPGTQDILVKPTPPARRKDSRSERETIFKEMTSQISKCTILEKTVSQEMAVEELIVKPTPPVRRKGSQVSQVQELEEILVKPTPPTRRRDSRNFSDRAYEEKARKISSSTDLVRTVTQDIAEEEPIIKPTPPVRRTVSSQTECDSVSVLSKIQEVGENVVKPTPPTRRRDSRNLSDIVAIRYSSSTDLETTVTEEKALAESLLKPTSPVRQKASQDKSNVISIGLKDIEPLLLKPTPPVKRRNSGNMPDTAVRRISGSSDLEKSTLVTPETAVEETLVKPTPPVRRKASRSESDISVVDETKEMEETLVKPTPPTSRKDSRNGCDIVAIKSSISTDLENSVMQEKSLEEPVIKPTAPASRKSSSTESSRSVVSETQEMEETLVKPTPPTQRRDVSNVSDKVIGRISSSDDLENVLEEPLIKPIPPGSGEPIESDVIAVVFKPEERDDTLMKPTPPTSRKDGKSVSDLENLVTEDRAAKESLVIPAPPEETLVKPMSLTCRRDSGNVDELVPEQIEGGEFLSSVDLDKTMSEERADMEVLAKTFPTVGQETSQAESDVSIVDKTQAVEETLVKPTAPARRTDSRNLDETVPKEMENEIFSSTDLNKTVTEESAVVEDLLKLSPPVGREASQAESDISSMVSKPQELEETLVKLTPPARRSSQMKSHTVTNGSPSEAQEGLIEPNLKGDDNEVEHESIKLSSVSTELKEALPEPTTPIDQKTETTTYDDTIPIKVDEPLSRPTPLIGQIETSVEIQSTIKQEDEHPEKELCAVPSMEPTESVNKIENISLVEVTGKLHVCERCAWHWSVVFFSMTHIV